MCVYAFEQVVSIATAGPAKLLDSAAGGGASLVCPNSTVLLGFLLGGGVLISSSLPRW